MYQLGNAIHWDCTIFHSSSFIQHHPLLVFDILKLRVNIWHFILFKHFDNHYSLLQGYVTENDRLVFIYNKCCIAYLFWNSPSNYFYCIKVNLYSNKSISFIFKKNETLNNILPSLYRRFHKDIISALLQTNRYICPNNISCYISFTLVSIESRRETDTRGVEIIWASRSICVRSVSSNKAPTRCPTMYMWVCEN